MLLIVFSLAALSMFPLIKTKTGCGFYRHRWEKEMEFCYEEKKHLLIGDFNGDGHKDMACYEDYGTTFVSRAEKDGTFDIADFKTKLPVCGSQPLVGDFNGDSRGELLCYSGKTIKWIAYTSHDGAFNQVKTIDEKWCHRKGDKVFVGDFNGDKLDDLLCHNSLTGAKQISYSNVNGAFAGRCWSYSLGWCKHETSQLHIGDFNGDGRADLLCSDKPGGIYVNYARADGTFYGLGWKYKGTFCKGFNKKVMIGDFNADRRSDILCQGSDNGDKKIAYATPKGHFGHGKGQQWYSELQFCGHEGSQLHIGDFNNDRKDDILCHNVETGMKWVVYAECYSTPKFK